MASDSTSPEEYRSFPDLIRFPLADGHVLIYSTLSRAARAVSPVGQQLLQGCRTFATLDDHAARLCRELNLMPVQRDAVRAELAALAAAGLLTARGVLMGRRGGILSEAAPPITTVGIPTRDRTQSLQLCLMGHLEQCKRRGEFPVFVVVDDSVRKETRELNRQTLRELTEKFGAAGAYAGPEERSRYAADLAREAGIPPEDVSFGLINDCFPIGTGASRNALLMHTVGELLLQVDDDTLATPAQVPLPRSELALSSGFDPTEFWFYSGADPWPPEGNNGPDLLSLHQQLLGRPVADLLAEPGRVLDLNTANASFFRRMETGGGRIVVASLGVIGDSGMGSPFYLLTLDGDSRVRLLGSESDYRRSLASHQVRRAVTRTTVCEAAFCMAPNLSLDNRDLLPPFLPVQRNQDGVFGAILRSCGFGFFGFLPWVVRHRPPVARSADANIDWRRAARPHTGHLVQILVNSFSAGPGSASSESKLQTLGEVLEGLGRSAAGEFEELVRLHVWNAMSRQVTQFEALLKRFGSRPDYWAADVRRVLAGLLEGLADPEFTVPWDLVDAFGVERARTLFQEIVRRFGRLLRDWPALIQAARRLRGRGVRLAVTA